MGVIKRIIRGTSRKILSKIVPNGLSQQLILNQPAQPGEITTALHKSSKQRAASLHKKSRKSNGKDTAVVEALLLAAKNYLPPVQFHHVHGPNAQLSSSKNIARRTQGFCQALVFSNRVILPNERVYIKVLEIAKGWSGTIRFGFTAVDPATLAYRMPKHACPDMTNAGHTWARALADEVVRRNSVIHFSYNKDGLIHYGINNQDCGIFHANVSTNQNLWFIVDIYGLTAAVELIDPRVNNNPSPNDLEFSPRSYQEQHDDRSTMFKSTSIMDDIFGVHQASPGSRSRRKQSKRAARRALTAGLIHADWPLNSRAIFEREPADLRILNQYDQRADLPNLDSTTLPSAQQNIYSPMPANANSQSLGNPREFRPKSQPRGAGPNSHDYHQIMSNNNVFSTSSIYQPVRGQTKLNSAASLAHHHHNQAQLDTSSASSANIYSNTSQDLCRDLENVHLNEGARLDQSHQISSPSRSARASITHHQTPVAATRRRQQQSASAQVQTKHRSSESRDQTRVASAPNHRVGSSKPHASSSASPSDALLPSSNSKRTLTASAQVRQTTIQASSEKDSVKPKVRHSINKQPQKISITNRDNNNNSPPSKDCPICFERPINCVLYQCGHMCTCYECGVKQWKTQSRTCPICRTVIKDVIKTYMS